MTRKVKALCVGTSASVNMFTYLKLTNRAHIHTHIQSKLYMYTMVAIQQLKFHASLIYRIAGNFRARKLMQMIGNENFKDKTFTNSVHSIEDGSGMHKISTESC